MSISQNFPEEGPTLNLNFAGSKTLDPRITFSRTTTGTYMDDSGLIVTAPADAPRFDHRYVNGEIESLGLLVEEGRTNLVTDSNGGDYGYDMSSGGSPTNDIAPDGSTVACKYDLSSATGSPFLNCNVDTTLTNGVTYTMSMWVKGTTEFTVALAFVGETNYTVTSRNMNVTTSWTRETYTFTLSGNQTNSRLQVFFGTQGQGKIISIWGAQLEEGAFATSYIPRSAGSQSTRNPDSVTMTGNNFSDWYNQDEGTIYVSQKLRAVQDTGRNNLVYLINANGNGNDYFYNTNKGNQHIFVFGDGGTNYSRFADAADSTDSKTAWAYDVSGDDFKAYYNGIEATNETTTNTPSATSHNQLELGANISAKYCGHIQQFVYYPTRLTNTQLQTLTK